MTIRTAAEMVTAASHAIHLQALALGYLQNYRQYANGVNDVRVPNEAFMVAVHEVEKGGGVSPCITFSLQWIETVCWQVPVYHSPDSPMVQEGFGSDNVSGYKSESQSSPSLLFVTIPVSHLMEPYASQIEYLKKLKIDHDAALKEKERIAEVARLKAEIHRLESAPAP